jgi:hypothetical protein
MLASPEVRWPLLRGLLIYHDLIPFFHCLARESPGVPPEFSEELRTSYYFNLAQDELMWREFCAVNARLSSGQVMMVPIKGMSFLKTVYTGMPFRPMCDIDLLVSEEDMARVERLLAESGYVKELEGLDEEYWLKEQCHIVFTRAAGRRPFRLEAHFGLDFKRGYEMLPGLWPRTREVDIEGQKVRFLSVEDQVFSLVLHMRRYGKVINLKNVLDCALLIERADADFDWDYCLREAGRGKMRTALFFLLHLCARVGLSVPPGVIRSLRIPAYKQWMIKRLVDKHLFSVRANEKLKEVYTRSHFLLYDSFAEPLRYVFDIPHEQFCKYYNLTAYTPRSRLLFRWRFLYMPWAAITGIDRHGQRRR